MEASSSSMNMMMEVVGVHDEVEEVPHDDGSAWKNPSGTLKGVGPGTELDWYVQQLRADRPNVVKVDLCKQMLGPEGPYACAVVRVRPRAT
jgi:hypothetical protein